MLTVSTLPGTGELKPHAFSFGIGYHRLHNPLRIDDGRIFHVERLLHRPGARFHFP